MPIKNVIPGQRVTKEKLQRAKELRREMTPAERLLWQEVRAKKLGVCFRPPPPYRGTSPKYDNVNFESTFGRDLVVFGGGRVGVVDFYCHKAALVVEVDGDIHDLQQEEDARREKALRDRGLRIVRFRNDEILKDLLMVVERIKELALT